MSRCRLTALAAKDLREIGRYTRQTWGVLQARRYREEFDLALQKLSLVPNAGRPRPDLAPRLRSFVVASHVVFYVPRRGGVTVVRVLHASMDVERALPREQN
jgi:toxin ParE1/3/4